MRLKKLRIERRNGVTHYLPIGSGARGANVFLEPYQVKDADQATARKNNLVVLHIERWIPKRGPF